MLIVKKRMNIIKKPGKKDNARQRRPLTSHNLLKITTQKMSLKTFSTSTFITTQSQCRSRRVQMPKKMASKPPKVDIQN